MASKLYYNPETAVVWAPSGGDLAFTPTSLAVNNVQVGAQWDRGGGAKPGRYRWFARSAMALGSAGLYLIMYIAQAKDSTDLPGRISTSDSTISAGQDVRMYNLDFVGILNAESTTGSIVPVTGEIFIHSRYVSPAWYNRTQRTLSSTGSDHEFVLQPIPEEYQ